LDLVLFSVFGFFVFGFGLARFFGIFYTIKWSAVSLALELPFDCFQLCFGCLEGSCNLITVLGFMNCTDSAFSGFPFAFLHFL